MPEAIPLDAAAAETLRRALDLDGVLPQAGPDEIRRHFPKSALFVYPAKSYVLQQGESTRDLYVVVSGLVTVTRMDEGRASKLGTLGAEQVFGEMALVQDGARVASAIATEESRIFRLSYPDVESLLGTSKELGEHLRRLAEERGKGN